jgi:ferrous-iron efflux pump FieF
VVEKDLIMHSHSGHSHSSLDAIAYSRDKGILMRRAIYVAVVVSLGMIGLKAYAWLKTGSLSLLSSLIDSGMDMAASLVNLFAIHRALSPANQEYGFGQSKAESLAALSQSIFIGASSLFLVHQALERFAHPEELVSTQMGLWVMGVASVATLGVVCFQRYVIGKTNSLAIQADELHYKTDLLMNLGVFVTLLLSGWLHDPWIDPAFAICIAGYIFYTAVTIGKSSVDVLMDRELPQEVRDQILQMAFAHPQVRGVHDLRTRSGGARQFAQLHLELDGHITLAEAHQIADKVEREISSALPHTEVIIHQDLHMPHQGEGEKREPLL